MRDTLSGGGVKQRKQGCRQLFFMDKPVQVLHALPSVIIKSTLSLSNFNKFMAAIVKFYQFNLSKYIKQSSQQN